MRILFSSAFLMLALAACVSVQGGSSPYTETSAVCDSSGIEARYTYLRDASKGARAGIGVDTPIGSAGIGGSGYDNDVEKRTLTIQRRLNKYDAQVDTFYRNATNSCKLAARCMEMNRYDEGKCRSSIARWDEAEEEYADLLVDLAEIEAEVQNIRNVSRRRGGGKSGYSVNPCDSGGRNCGYGAYGGQ